jgi:hypothetical protein
MLHSVPWSVRRFTNAATEAESVSAANRSSCSVLFLVWPVTNDAAMVRGVAEARRPELIVSTTSQLCYLLQWPTVRRTVYQRRDFMTFHQRLDSGGSRYSGTVNRLQFPILDMTCYQRRRSSEWRCCGTSSGRRFTNDATVVESVTIPATVVTCFALFHDPCDILPTPRLWQSPLQRRIEPIAVSHSWYDLLPTTRLY